MPRGSFMKKNEKEERLYLCLRYKCKVCPRARKCEEELRKNNLEHLKKVGANSENS